MPTVVWAGDRSAEGRQARGLGVRELAAEAEALWGTTDRAGNFVPGLLMPSLEVYVERA
jgi:hypothetical protein